MWDSIDPAILAQLPRQSANGAVANGLPPPGRTDWAGAIRALERFRREYAEDDWDGQGAVAVSGELIDSAAALAAALERQGVTAPTWTLPGPDGSVSYSWDLGAGATAEIEVTGPTSAEVVVLASDRPAGHWVLGPGATAR
ncbi:MAG TPA: hypothetical protein VM533_05010 [Fimbriiglobus sp.]|jgi:hypothetical protein|nr:hypothetical protein [Fimbriiglobus sp.]